MENSLKKIIDLSFRLNMPVVVHDPISEHTGVVMHVDIFSALKTPHERPLPELSKKEESHSFFPSHASAVSEKEPLFSDEDFHPSSGFSSSEALFPGFLPQEENDEEEPIFFEEPV